MIPGTQVAGGYVRILVISSVGTATALASTNVYDEVYEVERGEPFNVHEHIAQTKEERKQLYRFERLREASTAMHFAGQRTPRREARQHGDPLRHHRLRGFRRASRRDQTDVMKKGTDR